MRVWRLTCGWLVVLIVAVVGCAPGAEQSAGTVEEAAAAAPCVCAPNRALGVARPYPGRHRAPDGGAVELGTLGHQ